MRVEENKMGEKRGENRSNMRVRENKMGEKNRKDY